MLLKIWGLGSLCSSLHVVVKLGKNMPHFSDFQLQNCDLYTHIQLCVDLLHENSINESKSSNKDTKCGRVDERIVTKSHQPTKIQHVFRSALCFCDRASWRTSAVIKRRRSRTTKMTVASRRTAMCRTVTLSSTTTRKETDWSERERLADSKQKRKKRRQWRPHLEAEEHAAGITLKFTLICILRFRKRSQLRGDHLASLWITLRQKRSRFDPVCL